MILRNIVIIGKPIKVLENAKQIQFVYNLLGDAPQIILSYLISVVLC